MGPAVASVRNKSCLEYTQCHFNCDSSGIYLDKKAVCQCTSKVMTRIVSMVFHQKNAVGHNSGACVMKDMFLICSLFDKQLKLCCSFICSQTLLTKIEDLEKGSSAQSATKREVELMLRRQLAEVTAQRDERTVELQAEQRKSKVLCERLDRFTERSHNL